MSSSDRAALSTMAEQNSSKVSLKLGIPSDGEEDLLGRRHAPFKGQPSTYHSATQGKAHGHDEYKNWGYTLRDFYNNGMLHDHELIQVIWGICMSHEFIPLNSVHLGLVLAKLGGSGNRIVYWLEI